jgi:protein TonB
MSMNLRTVVAVIAPLVLAGCAGTQQTDISNGRPEIISATPLPPITWISYASEMKLNVLIHVMQDGTVENARILGSGGDPAWDSLATRAMKQWRYEPPRRDGMPTDLWVRQTIVVQFKEPVVMTIGELVSADQHGADSLYALLGKGTDLDALFNTSIGKVDIAAFPPNVRDELRRLKRGESTAPLRVRNRYIIYKRF